MAGQERELEIARHDANDDVGFAIEKNGGPEDPGTALVTALPQTVTEHDDWLLVLVFVLGEDATEERRDLQRGKDIAAHPYCMNCFGNACGGQVIAFLLIAAEVGKAVGVAHVVADIDGGGSRLLAHQAIGAFEGVSQNHQAVWAGEGKRAEKNAGDDGKYSSGGSDAKG